MARRLEGAQIAEAIKRELAEEVARLKKRNVTPGLAAVLVGDNPASVVYVENKIKACDSIGIHSETHRYPATVSEGELLDRIGGLNRSTKIHGILLQLPLPDQISADRLVAAVSAEKDVDGLHPVNRGLLHAGRATLAPCTPLGVLELLGRYQIPVAGRHVVILGRSQLVGIPLALLLLQKSNKGNATVTVCHSQSERLPEIARQADIVIAAIGRPQFVTADMIKPGAVVVDVGINRVEDLSSPRGYRLVGDVNFDEVQQVASAITPVPGGVGPMTIAMLLYNTITAAKNISRQ